MQYPVKGDSKTYIEAYAKANGYTLRDLTSVSAVGADFRPNRINVVFDKQDKVKSVTTG